MRHLRHHWRVDQVRSECDLRYPAIGRRDLVGCAALVECTDCLKNFRSYSTRMGEDCADRLAALAELEGESND